MPHRLSTLLLGGALLLVGGCGKAPELHVTGGWVRLSAVPSNPSAAYFTIHGGETDSKLLDVNTSVAIRSELHESMGAGGMAQMKPLGTIDIPAKATVKFEPGSKHMMLWNINPGIKPGKTVPLIFTFSSGERIQYDAQVQAAGAAAPVDDETK